MKKEDIFKETLKELLTYNIGEEYKEIIRETLTASENYEETLRELATYNIGEEYKEIIREALTTVEKN